MDFTFLSLVAATGLNCFAGFTPSRDDPSSDFIRHIWVDFRDEAAVTKAYRELQMAGARGIYFTPGAFSTQSRNQNNCTGLRSFFLDLDAGADKLEKHGVDRIYINADDAYLDLHDKLEGKFPKPTYIVHSGTGIHAYWVATEDIPYDQWKQLANKFKLFCRLSGLKIDPARTSDGASLMRVVGSMHQSAGVPAKVIEANNLFTKDQLVQAIDALVTPTVVGGNTVPNDYEYGDILQQVTHRPCSFGKIIETHELTGNGCQALYDIYKNQETQSYSDWIAILSVANSCVDRDEWIHKVSSGYPGYSYEATEEKAASLKAPFKCVDIMAIDPKRCEGCPLAGRFSSPIVIGRDPATRPVKVVAPLGTDKSKSEEFVIPAYPFPFFRGANGGIYIEEEDAETGTVKNVEVFPHDFYIYERISSNGKQLYWCRYHSPHDGVKEFDMDSTMIHSITTDMKDCLTGQGMAITNKKQWGYMSMFLQQFNKQLVESKAALREVTQQGWQFDSRGVVTSFVHGKHEITANGNKPAPIGDKQIAKKLAPAFTPKFNGDEMVSLEQWNYCLYNMYHNKAAVPNQLIICSALGAPFASRYALSNNCGGVISLASTASGRGKTYTCMTALRVWANPTDLTFASKSGVTINALMTNLGYANSLPILRDEITEMEPEEIADLIYDSTRLGDKERAQGSENDIRGNRNTWRTFFYVTSNRSLYDVIASDRTDGDGPMMRVTEMMIDHNGFQDPKEANRLAAKIAEVHGVAGRFLIEWMMQNPEEAERLWNETLDWFIAETKAAPAERFWVTHLVSACVGAKIGEILNLHPFKAQEIIDHAKEVLNVMRERVSNRTNATFVPMEVEPETVMVEGELVVTDEVTDGQEDMIPSVYKAGFLGDFFTDNINRILVMKGGNIPPVMPRAGEVYVRIEKDKQRMFIRVDKLQEYCQRKRISTDLVVKVLTDIGGKRTSFRLLSGLDIGMGNPSVRVWELPCIDFPEGDTVSVQRYDTDALINVSYGETNG